MNRGPRSVRRGAPLQSRLASMVSLALNYAETGSMVDRRSGVVPYFTRATTASVPGFEKLDYAISGEARMGGMRRVYNRCGNSVDLSTAGGWSTTGSPTIASGVSDPDGGTTAYTVTAGAGASQWLRNIGTASTDYVTWSVWIKRRTGSGNIALLKADGSTQTVSVTSSWQRFSVTSTGADYIGIYMATGADAVDVWHPLAEKVTGQSNQNPSEYVSVGAAKRNRFIYTEQFENWTAFSGATVVANSHIAPDGALTADRITDPAGSYSGLSQIPAVTGSATYCFSLYIRKTTGALSAYPGMQLTYNVAGNAFSGVLIDTTNGTLAIIGGGYTAPTGSGIESVGDYWRVYVTQTMDSGATTSNCQFYPALSSNGTTIDASAAGSAVIWGAQLEEASTPGTYFKVENVYPYHGAMVDGVKYFPTENGNTVSSNVVTEATGPSLNLFASAWLPGTSGSYFTTPDSAANSITGDIDFKIKASMDDWTPSATQALGAKFSNAGNNDSWYITVGTDGKPTFNWREADNSINYIACDTATGFANGTTHWLRFTLTASTGAVRFYTSEDGSNWTQLGSTDTSAGATDIKDSTATLMWGIFGDGASNPLAGRIYRAQIFDEIDGTTPVVDFNPYSATETRATNLALQSQTFATTWTTSGTAITTDAATAPDGTTTAEKWQQSGATSYPSVFQSVTVGVATHTFSAYLKAGTTTKACLELRYNTGDDVTEDVEFDLVAGTATVNGASTLSPTGTITSVGNGWYRCSVTKTAPALTISAVAIIRGGAIGTDVTGLNIYLWGAQLETGSSVSPYVPTTTVARNGTSWESDTGEWWYSYGAASIKKNTIKGLLIEEARTNLVLQSENFGTTWTTGGTSPTRSAAAKTLGGLSLDLLGDDDAAAAERYLQNITFTGDAVKAFSFFFAQGTSTTTQFSLWDTIGAAWKLLGFITWQNGYPVVTMSVGTLLRLEYWGSGIYRLHAQTTSVTAANAHQIDFRMASDGAVTVTLTGNIYLGGVQAENGTEPSTYQPTTTLAVARNADVAAITSLGGWFNRPRTNLCLQSNALTTTWSAVGTPAATQDAVGPDGVANSAWTLTDNDAGAYEGITQTAIAFAAGATGTASVFVKKKASSPVYPLVLVYSNVAASTGSGIIVNEVAGTIAVVATGGVFVAPVSSGIEDFNDDYWRVSITVTQAGVTLQAIFELYPAASTNGTTLDVAGQGSTVFADAQFERGDQATDYIATTTAAVTEMEGSFVSEASSVCSGAASHGVLSLDDTTFNERINIQNSGINVVVTAGAQVSLVETMAANVFSRHALVFKKNDAAVSMDGAAVQTDTSCAMPIPTRLQIGALAGGNYALGGYIKTLNYYPRRLPNTVLPRLSA